MTHQILRLNFGSNRVHLGGWDDELSLEGAKPHLLADTFFSAICHGWLRLYGKESLTDLLKTFQSSEPPWRMSDGFPYFKRTALLPKPAGNLVESFQKKGGNEDDSSSQMKKRLKKLNYLFPDDILPFIHTGRIPEEFLKEDYKELDNLWETTAVPQVQVSRTGGDSEPYSVSYLSFAPQAGLWILFDISDENRFSRLKEVIAYLGEVEGIGGEKSTGAGRFSPYWSSEDDKAQKLLKDLENNNLSPKADDPQLLLSITNPDIKAGEAAIVQDPRSRYQLVYRKGFMFSADSGWPGLAKKRPVAMLMAGSLLPKAIHGRLVDVTPELNTGEAAPHSIYRYGIALSIGVSQS